VIRTCLFRKVVVERLALGVKTKCHATYCERVQFVKTIPNVINICEYKGRHAGLDPASSKKS